MADAREHRPEIHGIRGVGIVLVMLYHLWTNGRVSGGVDVFLFVSAYLMTASYLRRGSAFRVVGFLVQRFRRLVPQAALVIAATLVAGWLVLPPTRWLTLLDHAQSSLFYVENWRLIEQSISYTAVEPGNVSPYQHFWSLSVQGQVFVIWPLLFAATNLLHERMGASRRLVLGVGVGLISAASFFYAAQAIASNPSTAYFDTWARVWEFGLASLVALMPRPTLSRAASALLSWTGVAAVLATGLLLGRAPYPGPAALLPLLGATAIILAGARPFDRAHPAWWLALRPVAFVANRAYGLYLWHWPVYAYYLVATDNTNPRTGVVGSAVVIAVSLLLADLSTRLVERRFHRLAVLRTHPGALTAIATFTIIVVGMVQGFARYVDIETRNTGALPAEARPGAKAVTPGATPSATPVRRSIAPGDAVVGTDWPVDAPLCREDLSPAPPVQQGTHCRELLPDGEPRGTVMVLGDSHSYQWLTALRPLAQREGWHVILLNRPNCRLTVDNPLSDEACVEYSEAAVEYVLEVKPDYVVNIGSRAQEDGPELEVEGYADAIRPVAKAKIPVVNIRDNPRWSFRMPECVQLHGSTDPRCTARRADKLQEVWPHAELADLPHQYYLDLNDYVCPGGPEAECRGVVGNVYVYMDSNHLSATYIATLADEFEARWRAVVPR